MGLQVITPKNTSYIPESAISNYAFRARFANEEKVALELASIDDPITALNTRQSAAALRVFLADVAAARYIDLSVAATRAGVQFLETLGLLATGRAAEILDAPIMNFERPAPTNE